MIITSIVINIVKIWTVFTGKTNEVEVRTPLVSKNKFEKSEVDAEKIRFIPIAAMNVFALLLERIVAIKKIIAMDRIHERETPSNTEPVKSVNKKHVKAENEINPSKNKARLPVYSVKRAPQEASKRGQE